MYTIKDLSKDLSEFVYNQSKAKIFNILESQIDNDKKLKACKSITTDTIDYIGLVLANKLNDIFPDWEIDIEKNCENCRNNVGCTGYDCRDADYKHWRIDLKFLSK